MTNLFFTEKALVFVGASSSGKTTLINNFLKFICKIDSNLITSPTTNTTKILTIISFIPNNEKPYFNKFSDEKKNEFENVNELFKNYNEISKETPHPCYANKEEKNIFCVQIFLPTKYYDGFKEFCLIDVIGQLLGNRDNDIKYKEQIEFINRYFPNNDQILITESLDNISSNYSNIIVTFADKQYLEDDQGHAKRERYKEYLKYNKNVYFVDNIGEKNVLQIDESNYQKVYNKNNFEDLIIKLYKKCHETNNIDLYEINDFCKIIIPLLLLRYSYENILDEIYRFNKKEIYIEFEKNGRWRCELLMENLNKANEFKKYMEGMKGKYKLFKRGAMGVRCEKEFKEYIMKNLGRQYRDYKINIVYDKYIQDQHNVWEDYIRQIYQQFCVIPHMQLMGIKSFTKIRREQE